MRRMGKDVFECIEVEMGLVKEVIVDRLREGQVSNRCDEFLIIEVCRDRV